MAIVRDAVWRVLCTRPFDSVRPKFCHSNVYLLDGKLKRSNSDFSTVVFGREEAAEYLSKLIYADNLHHEFLGKRTVNEASLVAEEATKDLVIVETSWALSSFLLASGFLVLPQLNFTLDITGSLEELQKSMAMSKIRRIKRVLKADFSWTTTRDPAELQAFYYEMYLPHMLAKHGKSAIPVSFSECKRLFSKGDLLLVNQDRECVAGVVLVPHGEELYQPLIAVKDIDKQMTLGSYAATYYTIVFGKQKGYSRVDFGDAPPFLQDGLFQYKREWGMRIRPALGDGARVFGVRLPRMSEAAKDFLSTNSFVISEGQKLKGLTFRFAEEADMLNFFNVPGLSSVFVISPHITDLNQGSSESKKRTLEKADVKANVSLGGLIGMCREKDWVVYELPLSN